MHRHVSAHDKIYSDIIYLTFVKITWDINFEIKIKCVQASYHQCTQKMSVVRLLFHALIICTQQYYFIPFI